MDKFSIAKVIGDEKGIGQIVLHLITTEKSIIRSNTPSSFECIADSSGKNIHKLGTSSPIAQGDYNYNVSYSDGTNPPRQSRAQIRTKSTIHYPKKATLDQLRSSTIGVEFGQGSNSIGYIFCQLNAPGIVEDSNRIYEGMKVYVIRENSESDPNPIHEVSNEELLQGIILLESDKDVEATLNSGDYFSFKLNHNP